MNILENVSLTNHSTMRLGGNTAYAVEIQNENDLQEAISWAKEKNLPLTMIGSGSNIIWSDNGFSGLLLINKIMDFELKKNDDQTFLLHVGAGEVWDKVVEQTVSAGASGIEALSLIPGTVGATPIQNVGAYGQEIAQTLVNVRAYDTKTDQFVTIAKTECGFSYRSSRFKTTDRGRFLITGLTLQLSSNIPQPPFYPAVQDYLNKHDIHNYSSQAIRDAVIAIRNIKMPDPAFVANSGSFFGNPIVEQKLFEKLLLDNPTISSWPVDNEHVKLSAAWLIEHAGFKNIHDPETGMATWENQPLVLINEHAKKTADLLKFKQKIVTAVQMKFGVNLKQEPELLP